MHQPFAYPVGPGVPGFRTSGFGTPLRGYGAATRTAQSIGIEWLDYAKQSYDDLTAAAEKLAAARTPAAALAIQGAFLRTAGERFSARSAVFGGLFATLAADLAQPAGAAVPVPTR